MSLSIDQQKIDALLATSATTAYIVTPCNLELPAAPYAGVPTVHVFSTVTTMPPDLERARARLLSLRQRLIDNGVQPLSPQDLDHHINETRGRH